MLPIIVKWMVIWYLSVTLADPMVSQRKFMAGKKKIKKLPKANQPIVCIWCNPEKYVADPTLIIGLCEKCKALFDEVE